MKSGAGVFVAAAVGMASSSSSAEPCPTPSIKLKAGATIEPPKDFPNFEGVKTVDGKVESVTVVAKQKIKPTDVEAIGKLKVPFFEFSSADRKKTCAQMIETPDAPNTLGKDKPETASNAGHSASAEDCHAAGAKWATEIVHQAKNYTMIVFAQSGEVCYANRLYGVAGDPIYIGLWVNTGKPVQWKPLQFTPCSLEDATPAIFVSADSVSLTPNKAQQDEYWDLLRGQPRQCFNDSVGISATTQANDQAVAFTLLQYRQYRATLQLGVLFTDQHTSSFGLATNGAGDSVIRDSAAHGNGPEYVAGLVIYGLPHYVGTLFRGPAYRGRDILHEQDFFDRLGLVLGVGLTEPTRRFTGGVSFEIMYGLNLLITADVHRQTALDPGIDPSMPFMGTAAAIPTHDDWNTKMVVGLSLDLRYVQELFSGKIHP